MVEDVFVTDDELDVLRRYVKTSPLVLVRFKAQAVLMASEDLALESIGLIFDRSVDTVKSWLSDWNNFRLSSIFSGHANNENAAKLTIEQKSEIAETLKTPPSENGLPKEFWDVPQLKNYLIANFEIAYESDRSYHYLLKFSGLNFKYPDVFNRRRNEEFIEARMAEIRQELQVELSDPNTEVFAADEVRIDQEAEIRRAWLQRGKRTIVKVNKDKESQSYLGFLNQKTFDCELYKMDWQNQQEVLEVFKEFLEIHPKKRIVIVWDNAPFHKGKEIREALKTGNLLERVHLIAMPPHAPDHNPIEHVWNTTKAEIANIQHDDFEQTKEAFSGYISSRTFEYRI